MKTFVLSLLFVLNLFSSTPVKAQHPVNNNIVFKVEGTEDYPMLVWINKKEINTSYYIVEYSFDNINFNTLFTRNAVGSSNFPVKYNYCHIIDKKNNSNTQMRYYRIVLVLMGGSRLFSETKAYIPIDPTLDLEIIANLDN